MRQVRSEKSNVAWFALAECISRGEKERALGVYRLLSHSFEDRALTLQLEADILWSFRDEGALKKYQEAAALLMREQRYLEAVAILEHVLTCAPHLSAALESLAHAYGMLGQSDKIVRHATLFFQTASVKKEFSSMRDLLHALDSEVDSETHARLYYLYSLALLKQHESPEDVVRAALHKTVDALVKYSSGHALQQFLAQVQEISPHYYQYVSQCMQEEHVAR